MPNLRELIIHILFLSFLFLIVYQSEIVDCGPYCCAETIVIPISCSDGLGGTTNEYVYTTDVGTIEINPITGLPEIVIEQDGMNCENFTFNWRCECIEYSCFDEQEITILIHEPEELTVTVDSPVCIDEEDVVIETTCIDGILGSPQGGTPDPSVGTITFAAGELSTGLNLITVNCRRQCLVSEEVEVYVCEKPFFNPSCFSPTTPPQ